LRWRNSDEDGNVATLDGAITRLDDIAHPDPLFEPIHQAYLEKYGSPAG
jgi:hypothetical protein